MQLLPRDSHGFARLQVFDSASDFFVPCLLDRFVRNFKTVDKVLANAARSSTGSASARLRRSEVSGLIALFYAVPRLSGICLRGGRGGPDAILSNLTTRWRPALHCNRKRSAISRCRRGL